MVTLVCQKRCMVAYEDGMGRWLRGLEHWLICQRTGITFLAHGGLCVYKFKVCLGYTRPLSQKQNQTKLSNREAKA